MSWFASISAPARARLQGLRGPALAFALVAASLTSAAAARADLDLQWDAPPNCPQRREVLDRIRAIAGSALDETDALSVAGRIRRVHGRDRLELLVRDGPHVRRRVIAADSCSVLADAAAATLALLLGAGAGSEDPSADDDPAALERSSRASEPSAADRGERRRDERGAERQALPGSPERVEPDRVAPAAPAASTAFTAKRPWALVVRGPVLAADLGPLPSPALGVGVGIGMRYEAWAVLLTGHLSREQTLSALGPDGPFGAELQRATGQLLACHGWRWSQLEIAPCVGVAFEHVTARGFGAGVSPQARRALWPAPGAGAVAYWYALESLAFFVAASGYLELSRPRLVIQDLADVRQLGPAAVVSSLGLEWIL
jgi:hypothetical protein